MPKLQNNGLLMLLAKRPFLSLQILLRVRFCKVATTCALKRYYPNPLQIGLYTVVFLDVQKEEVFQKNTWQTARKNVPKHLEAV